MSDELESKLAGASTEPERNTIKEIYRLKKVKKELEDKLDEVTRAITKLEGDVHPAN